MAGIWVCRAGAKPCAKARDSTAGWQNTIDYQMNNLRTLTLGVCLAVSRSFLRLLLLHSPKLFCIAPASERSGLLQNLQRHFCNNTASCSVHRGHAVPKCGLKDPGTEGSPTQQGETLPSCTAKGWHSCCSTSSSALLPCRLTIQNQHLQCCCPQLYVLSTELGAWDQQPQRDPPCQQAAEQQLLHLSMAAGGGPATSLRDSQRKVCMAGGPVSVVSCMPQAHAADALCLCCMPRCQCLNMAGCIQQHDNVRVPYLMRCCTGGPEAGEPMKIDSAALRAGPPPPRRAPKRTASRQTKAARCSSSC